MLLCLVSIRVGCINKFATKREALTGQLLCYALWLHLHTPILILARVKPFKPQRAPIVTKGRYSLPIRSGNA